MHAIETGEQNPQAELSLLVAVTALFLLIASPQAADAPTGLAAGPAAIAERVMEWRPQSPPPWGDVDQAASDDVEAVPGQADRNRVGSADARTRTQR